MKTAVILIQCDDRPGIVARISDFIYRNSGNMISADQYSSDPKGGRFFMRVAFYFDEKRWPVEKLEKGFDAIADEIEAGYSLHYTDRPLRMGVLVSKADHCLYDILYRYKSGQIHVEIPFVVSNHPDLRDLAESHGIQFYHLPVSPDTKKEQQQQLLELSRETTDFLVLARYMQILDRSFLDGYAKDVINIHHSFLPSFKGAYPYRRAYERGVKVIGATAHFVTEDLDEGPIIEQIVEKVTHRDSEADLKQKGQNLENRALAGAIGAYAEHRILRDGLRTIVFHS